MTDDEVNEWVREVINYVEGRHRLEDPEWKLRSLHEEALKNFIERILRDGECRAIVQMPTGAGKSVVLATLAVACAKLREKKKLRDENRDVILVLAPLSRIKHQLHDEILRSGGVNWGGMLPHLSGSKPGCTGLYHTALIGEEDFILDGEEKTNSEKYGRVSEKVKEVLNINDGKCKVILLNAQAIPYLKDETEKFSNSVYDELLSRLLALFVDEIHYLYDPKGKLGEELKILAKNAKIALGFTATPLKDCFEIIGAVKRPTEGFLLGRPIHSVDLAKQTERIIIKNLHAVFYRTIHKLRARTDTVLGEEQEEMDHWRKACRDRVYKYVSTLFDELRKTYGENYEKTPFKVLILAPNTREANLWVEILKNKLQRNYLLSEFPIFVAHTKVENAYNQINSFVRSDRGFLVAVDMLKLGFDDPNLDVLVIARPIRSPVAYVQARGRVVRYPKNSESLKAKMGALLIHFAFIGRDPYTELENEKAIKKVEQGFYRKKDCKMFEFSGYEAEEIEELDAEVVVQKIDEKDRLSQLDQYLITGHTREEGVVQDRSVDQPHKIEENKKEPKVEEEISKEWKEVYQELVSRLQSFKVEDPDRIALILVKEVEKRNVNPLSVKLEGKFNNFQELLDYWRTNILGLDWKFSIDMTNLKEGLKVRLEKRYTYDFICKISINNIEKLGIEGLIDYILKEWKKQYRELYRDVSEDFVKLLIDQLCKQIYDSLKWIKEKEVRSPPPSLSIKTSYQTLSINIESKSGRKYIVVRIGNKIVANVRVRNNKYKTAQIIAEQLEKNLPKNLKDKESIINRVQRELTKLLV